MKEIKAYLPSELVEQLSNQAKEQGINRSELIRNRLMANPFNFKLSPNDFQKTVIKIRRRYSYGLDRQQAESVVAAVISELFNNTQNDINEQRN
jgi:hypothetical protein|tara:strand:- start:296 stop:577 length:282 start_codon:yes stop_codon:yes gene_type:complete